MFTFICNLEKKENTEELLCSLFPGWLNYTDSTENKLIKNITPVFVAFQEKGDYHHAYCLFLSSDHL